jgi:hypothetical protein
MTTPSYTSDHGAQALAKLAEQYKNKVKLAGLLGAYTAQQQACEDVIDGPTAGIITQFTVATATGAVLDLIGKLVGQPRNGLGDDDYRLWIKARIIANLSSGDPESIYAVFLGLLVAGQTMQITDYVQFGISQAGGGFALRIFGVTLTQSVAAMTGILAIAKAAGMRALLEYLSTGNDSTTFRWDTVSAAQSWDSGTFATASSAT